MYSAAIVIIDDVDALKQDVGGTAKSSGEGSPIKLAKARTDARQGKYKMFINGTPTDEENSLIWKSYIDTDQRKYFVPCPKCDHYQILDFWKIKFEKDEKGKILGDPTLICEKCSFEIKEHHKLSMMAKGKWMATTETNNPFKVGRWISSAYSLLGYTWKDMCQDFMDASRAKDRGDLTPLITFYNTRLGLPFSSKKKMAKVEHSKLYKLREHYKVVPEKAAVITAGIDIQMQRIEATIVAYTEEEKRYFLEHVIIGGDPWIKYGQPGSPWDQVEGLINRKYLNDFGSQQPILQTCIDMGYCTENVGDFINHMLLKGKEVVGVFGSSWSGKKKSFLGEETVNKYGVKIRELNVNEGKQRTHNQLLNIEATQMIHFNHHPSFSENFFRQLTVETLKGKTVNGKKVLYWDCPEHASNEATDTTNYSLAAFEIYNEFGIDWDDHIEWNKKGCKIVNRHGYEIEMLDEGVRV
jgi:phage terminase large subunit GpA-like protein